MNRVALVSVFIDIDLYSKCVLENSFIKDNEFISVHSFDNRYENKNIAVRYNNFLDNYDYSMPGWFVFCHSDWDLREDITPLLNSLDQECIYGPIGAALYMASDGSYVREYRGQCQEKKRDGSNARLLQSPISHTGSVVDTLDCQCLIVHSSLISHHKLRFDENLKFDLYVEDFCIKAFRDFKVYSKILSLNCCHWNQADSMDGRDEYFENLKYLNNKYKDGLYAGVVSLIGGEEEAVSPICLNITPNVIPLSNDADSRSSVYKVSSVPTDAVNDSKSILFRYVSTGATVLDVGCACGDLGVALHSNKGCSMYGMEYNTGSVLFSQGTGAYKQVIQVDLNQLSKNAYPEYFRKFDYIIFGDVLEHILDPGEVLGKMLCYLKPGGRFLVSLPNIAHASIKAGLLVDDFTYTDNGLLDTTHIRFFTHKTIPTFLAKNLLKIESFEVTSIGMWGSQPSDPFPQLPAATIQNIFEDPHSLICQYVMELSYAPQRSYEDCVQENKKISLIDSTKNIFINEHKRQALLGCALLFKKKASPLHPLQLDQRPIFLMAPFSTSGCIYAPIVAKYDANVIAAIDDYADCENIYGIPRWTSLDFLECIEQYPNALVVDFSSSPGGKSWVLDICKKGQVECVAINTLVDEIAGGVPEAEE